MWRGGSSPNLDPWRADRSTSPRHRLLGQRSWSNSDSLVKSDPSKDSRLLFESAEPASDLPCAISGTGPPTPISAYGACCPAHLPVPSVPRFLSSSGLITYCVGGARPELVRYHLFFGPWDVRLAWVHVAGGTPVEFGCLLTYRQLISGCRAVRNPAPR